MSHRCMPGCDCAENGNPTVTTKDGSSIAVQRASGDGSTLCWGAAGGRATAIGPGAPFTLAITVQQYSWLKARYGVVTARDAAGVATERLEKWVRINTVQAVGRQIIGSDAGINGNSIAADADNALAFGGSIPPINSSNSIRVTGVNEHPALTLDIDFDVEGRASQ